MQAVLTFPDFSPELFSISLFGFDFALRWYALAYIAGILIAWRLGVAALRRPALWPGDTPPLTTQQLEDLLTWIILGVILGGRLGFVLFYQPAYYLANPAEILMVWQGGMSFHGGLLGVVIASWIYALRHNIPKLNLADLVAHAVPPGLLLGRLSNFINAELWGRPSDVPWAFVFPGPAAQNCPDVVGLCARHPSQLYEGRDGGADPGRRSPVAGVSSRRVQDAWFRRRNVPERLWPGPFPGRVRAPTRRAVHLAWQSFGAGLARGRIWPDDGSDPVPADDGAWAVADLVGQNPSGPGARAMTLKRVLLERIAHSGPMTVADYMQDCLLHPEHGYYAKHEPFGTKGDFITAPEISQMFGELLGLSLAQSWLDQGRPTPFTLAELGPGRGTLTADMLRATRGVPGFLEAAQIVLLEASPPVARHTSQNAGGSRPQMDRRLL